MRDPLYSYIAYTTPQAPGEACEQKIIDDPWMQRLRRIRANQWAYMVYPGLQHTRFEHSLGVMHLAGEFARTWYAKYRSVAGSSDYTKRLPSVPFVEELLRLAGLLHDVGHGPFGHTFERAAKALFPGNGGFPTHEKVSAKIVEKHFAGTIERIARSPSGPFAQGEQIKWQQVALLIDHGHDPGGLELDEKRLMDQLQPIISSLFGADRLDYLARDAYHGGALEYGTMDIDRLRTTIYFDQQARIAIPHKSMPALRNMLLARLQMYETCYYHARVRAFEVDAEVNMAQTLQAVKFPPNLDDPHFLPRYQELDDHYVYGKSIEWAKEPNEEKRKIGLAWSELFNRCKRWNCVRSIQKRIADEYLTLVKNSIPEVETALTACLGTWRGAGQSPSGTKWPEEIPKGADLSAYVRVDAPAFAAGLSELLAKDSVYVMVNEDGTDDRAGPAANLLEQIAGVNFIFVRFLAVALLGPLVNEAVDALQTKEKYSYLRQG